MHVSQPEGEGQRLRVMALHQSGSRYHPASVPHLILALILTYPELNPDLSGTVRTTWQHPSGRSCRISICFAGERECARALEWYVTTCPLRVLFVPLSNNVTDLWLWIAGFFG